MDTQNGPSHRLKVRNRIKNSKKIEHWVPCKELFTHEQTGLASLVLSRAAQATRRCGVGSVVEGVILLGNPFDFTLGRSSVRPSEQGCVLLPSLSGCFLPRRQPLSLRVVKAFATNDASLRFERRKG